MLIRRAALYSALTRSATGQAITTYFNVISGPRRRGGWTAAGQYTWCCWTAAAARLTGMNCARRSASAAALLHEPLPVYTRIGGHAYGTIYQGRRQNHLPLLGAGKHETIW